MIDYFIASAGICNKVSHLEVQGIIPSSDHYPVMLTLDTPTHFSSSSCFVSPSPNLRYDPSRKPAYQAQSVDCDGLSTDLGRQLIGLHSLSAEEGIQLVQDCVMSAAQETYEKAK